MPSHKLKISMTSALTLDAVWSQLGFWVVFEDDFHPFLGLLQGIWWCHVDWVSSIWKICKVRGPWGRQKWWKFHPMFTMGRFVRCNRGWWLQTGSVSPHTLPFQKPWSWPRSKGRWSHWSAWSWTDSARRLSPRRSATIYWADASSCLWFPAPQHLVMVLKWNESHTGRV